ncbi:luciferase family protein [Nonomuraea sp. NPDC003804]|uniref:oxidoreductase n=1 Tax=Nonomuraea sp. NPDC003804 TaxID=3154547 RepID=UPI0033A6383F
MKNLFARLTVGKVELPNRLVMAPMTRNRAAGGLVTELTAEYYTQRASAGLIITEAVQASPRGQGYVDTPGLHSPEQVEAWSAVTEAVHAAGGRIFAQITHTGRIGHPVLYPDGGLPLAPSPVASGMQLHTADGLLDHPMPKEMTLDDITQTVADFVAAARNAIAAGFDGVELHGGNGFLIHQFLADNTNRRTDGYGGSVDNRIRFAVEVVQAVSDALGSERVAIRLAPGNTYNNIAEADPATVYTALVRGLAPYNLAYLHIVEYGTRQITELIRSEWPGTLILNPHPAGHEGPATPEVGAAALRDGVADAISLAEMWLANPDLPERVRAGGPYNTSDQASWYGGDHRGYTDYPTLLGLPVRAGEAPRVVGPAPHSQRSQIAPVMLQEELWQRMRALPRVYMAPTLVSVPHARSLFLPDGVGSGPETAFQKGREWTHIHPHHDGSLHLTLPEPVKDEVERAGWGVRHPEHHSILVYGPRTQGELEVVWRLVKLSYEYALGESR